MRMLVRRFGFISYLKKRKFAAFVVLVAIVIISYLLSEQIVVKASFYLDKANTETRIAGIVKMFLLLVLTCFYAWDKRQVLYEYIPLFAAIVIVGAERVNLIGYFVFLCYALGVRGGVNLVCC